MWLQVLHDILLTELLASAWIQMCVPFPSLQKTPHIYINGPPRTRLRSCDDCCQTVSGINTTNSSYKLCQSVVTEGWLWLCILWNLCLIFSVLIMIYWNVYLLWFTKSLYWVNQLQIDFCFLLVVMCKASRAWFVPVYSVKCIWFAHLFFLCDEKF